MPRASKRNRQDPNRSTERVSVQFGEGANPQEGPVVTYLHVRDLQLRSSAELQHLKTQHEEKEENAIKPKPRENPEECATRGRSPPSCRATWPALADRGHPSS